MAKHKDVGGLNFRDIELINQAFLMKVGWSLLNDPSALWVRVLHIGHVSWFIRNGLNVRFLDDV